MKKILILIFSLQILSNAKNNQNIRVLFKTNQNTNISLATKPVTIRNNYKPIDLTLSTKDRKFKLNFVLKGRINDTKKENVINNFEKVNIKFNDVLPDIKDREETKEYIDYFTDEHKIKTINRKEIYGIDFFDIEKESESVEYLVPKAVENLLLESGVNNNFESSISSDDGHGHSHNHGHSHGHSHSHKHNENEEEHEHEDHFKRENFEPTLPRYTIFGSSHSKVQSKLDLEYFNGKNGVRYIQYFTDFEEKEEGNKFKGDGILQFRNINVFDNKFSIAFTPRLYTRKFIKPYYADLDFDLRYKEDKDSTLGLFFYSAAQLDDLEHVEHTKNKTSLFYDSKEPYVKSHKFYEIVNHEHENKNQVKLRVDFSKENKKNINIFSELKKYKYDDINSKYESNIELNYKKTDFIIKNLIFSNDFKFKNNFEKVKYIDLVFRKNKKTLYEDEAYKIFVDQNIGENENIFIKKYKLKDRVEIHELNKNIYNEISKKYLNIYTYFPIGNEYKEKVKTNITEINNNSEIKYLLKNGNISLGNKVKYIIENVPENYKTDNSSNIKTKKYEVSDVVSLNYKHNENKNLILDLSLENNFSYFNSVLSKKLLKYYKNTITYGAKIGYRFKNKNYKIMPYTEFKHDLELRKGNRNSVKLEKEADKVVFGQTIYLKHGIDTELRISKGLKFNGNFSVKYKFDNSVYKNADTGTFAERSKNFSKPQPLFEISTGLTYIY